MSRVSPIMCNLYTRSIAVSANSGTRLDIYSEPPGSIPLLLSVLTFEATSYVNDKSPVQLSYAHQSCPVWKSVSAPDVDSQIITTSLLDRRASGGV